MNKMNKKGFTLIEMLVVIAIIAILVAIIIPVVGNSTTKAKAATDAANLRSAKASLTIMALNGDFDNQSYPYDLSSMAGTIGVPATGKVDGGAFTASVDALGNVSVAYGSNGIDVYAAIAGGSEAPEGGNGGGTGGNGGGTQEHTHATEGLSCSCGATRTAIECDCTARSSNSYNCSCDGHDHSGQYNCTAIAGYSEWVGGNS